MTAGGFHHRHVKVRPNNIILGGVINAMDSTDTTYDLNNRVTSIRFNPTGSFALPQVMIFTNDADGNVRAVVSEYGEVLQNSHYYAYGTLMDESFGEDEQPYLWGGKELENIGAIAEYDFESRSYSAKHQTFSQLDPNGIQHPHISPYAFAASNPVAYTDPSGKDALMTIQGNTITIKANVIIYGEYATDELAKIYQNKIDEVWGAERTFHYNDDVFNLIWDVSVRKIEDNEEMVFDGINNYLDIPESIDRSGIYKRTMNTGKLRDLGRHGMSIVEDNPAAHEFGHLLGLIDRYVDGDNTIWSNYRGDVMREPSNMPSYVTKLTLNNLFLQKVKNHQYLYNKFHISKSMWPVHKNNRESLQTILKLNINY